jgi:hypothetical protein
MGTQMKFKQNVEEQKWNSTCFSRNFQQQAQNFGGYNIIVNTGFENIHKNFLTIYIYVILRV